MMRSMYAAVSGLKTHQTKMDVIGNNIANVNTVAFKSSSVTFRDILYQTTSGASGANAATGVGGVNAKQIGLGVSMAATSVSIETAGASETTGNPFDLKLTDKNTTNFFIVNDGTKNMFTRAGSFYIDGAGNLCMTSTGYTVMGWQVDPTTNAIRKDTVSALRIMQENNLTSAPEATTNAVMSGVLDENDTDVNSDAGKIMNLNFYDDLGYQYTAKFAVKATGIDGKYKVSLSSILDSNNVNLIEGKTAEEISKLFGAAANTTSTVAALSPANPTFTVNADGTITDGTNTYTLNGAGTAFEYTDDEGVVVTSYTVAQIFGADASALLTGTLEFDSATATYSVKQAAGLDAANTTVAGKTFTVNADGTITDEANNVYSLNASGTAFEYTDAGTGAVTSYTIAEMFGQDASDVEANPALSIVFDAADGAYHISTKLDSANDTVELSVTDDGAITDGIYTYTLNEAGTAFEYTDANTGVTTSYTLEEVFGTDVEILEKDTTCSLVYNEYTNEYSIERTTLSIDEEVAKAFSGEDLDPKFVMDDTGVITNKDGSVTYTYVENNTFLGSDGSIVNASEIFTISETLTDYLGLGVDPSKANADYKFVQTTDDDGNISYEIVQKVPSYELVFSTANGLFESINNDPKSVTLKLGDATGVGEVNEKGNFKNISIDFTQCLNYNNSGKSTMGMDSGDVDGTTGKGRKLGNLIGISIDTNGKIFGSYDNGNTELLGQIAVAQFSNASGMEKIGESCYQTTLNSGEFDGIGVEVSADGSAMTTGELEMSNVDLSTEFTQMITTQRGFQANSRVITTSDTLLEELVNLKR